MELNVREALRYLGVKGEPDKATLETVTAVGARLTRQVRPKYTYRVFPLRFDEGEVRLEGTGVALTGGMAEGMLKDCDRAVILLCTLGAGFEVLYRAEQARDAARAAMLDACGSAWVEAGCDEAGKEIAARFPGAYLTDRFSPGYGDLPLALQPALCALLDGEKRLGVQVTKSLLMNPSKSVTAVIGLADRPQPARIRGCGFCDFRENCQFRKEGKTCGA